MDQKKSNLLDLRFHALTSERWSDFEKLFGERGACGGCWCMWWRLKRSEFERQKGEGNRRAMQRIVGAGEVPGILAYTGDEPVGWCSVAPRDSFPVLNRSRILKKVDERPTWSVVCFFIDKNYRNKGVSFHLVRAAIEYAKKQGGKLLEGYPVEPRKDRIPAAFAWTGLESAFRRAGFVEIARRSETRPIMRFTISEE
ncbi:MAG: GNAT family N-acetyltransferase [Proteobacteria bacterium]|nr:GNAT family N-acetyltransferase [Pseudomonadota bacterium]NIS68959.1 GNAT family N-acetyltransferase [Pseudomonadota bacterium]